MRYFNSCNNDWTLRLVVFKFYRRERSRLGPLEMRKVEMGNGIGCIARRQSESATRQKVALSSSGVKVPLDSGVDSCEASHNLHTPPQIIAKFEWIPRN